MLDDEFAAIIGAADNQLATNQLAKAQACLDLYEKDRGRRTASALNPQLPTSRIPQTCASASCAACADLAWAKACKWIWTDIPAPWLRGRRWASASRSRWRKPPRRPA